MHVSKMGKTLFVRMPKITGHQLEAADSGNQNPEG
jgi:hypothetical protein